MVYRSVFAEVWSHLRSLDFIVDRIFSLEVM